MAERALDPTRTRTARGSNRADIARQFALIAVAVLLYFGVRGRTEGEQALALRHGHRILDLESNLRFGLEHWLQGLIVDRHSLVTLANWVYIFGHWPVIVATLVWLFRRSRADFLLLRNALFVSGAIGLVIFMLYPVAPPRLLGIGLEDTVTTFSTSYHALQPPTLVNKYAAMPSLHVGWNLLVGIAIARAARRRSLRVLGLGSPLLMALAVVTTGNHYVLDAVVGAIIALVGLAVSARMSARKTVGGSTNRRRVGVEDATTPSSPGITSVPSDTERGRRRLLLRVSALGSAVRNRSTTKASRS